MFDLFTLRGKSNYYAGMRIAGVARSRRPRSGFVLIAAAVSTVVAIGCLGLAVDLGRMYIARSEAQAYADAAATDAALQLDGEATGILNALAVVARNQNRWELDTATFTGTTVRFATSAAGPWLANPSPANNYAFVRIQAHATPTLYFMPVLTAMRVGTVNATAIAGQVPKTKFKEALFPFSPFAHNTIGPDFGLIPGQDYTLRWASSPKLNSPNVCGGDNQAATIALANAQGGSERGFIEDSAASAIRATIEDDYQTVFRSIGDIVSMTGGTKQTELSSLNNRIHQDTDSASNSFAQYLATGTGNGRRIIAVPINDGGTPAGTNLRIVQIAAFFLHATGVYGNGGGQPWCAEYIGAWVQGADHKGAGTSGAYVVRLVD